MLQQLLQLRSHLQIERPQSCASARRPRGPMPDVMFLKGQRKQEYGLREQARE